MHTNLRVDGANCPFCLNDVIDHLRTIDGITSVESSISEGCIAIEHDDLDVAGLVDTIRNSLHGVTFAANEIVMSPIDPKISVLHCSHEPHRIQPSTELPKRLETVTDALARLRADGYTSDFFATDQGELACRGCDLTMDPADVRIDQTIRFEGDSNPDDQDIVFAIEWGGCGCRGVYSAAYGPTTPSEDAVVIRRLARAPRL